VGCTDPIVPVSVCPCGENCKQREGEGILIIERYAPYDLYIKKVISKMEKLCDPLSDEVEC